MMINPCNFFHQASVKNLVEINPKIRKMGENGTESWENSQRGTNLIRHFFRERERERELDMKQEAEGKQNNTMVHTLLATKSDHSLQKINNHRRRTEQTKIKIQNKKKGLMRTYMRRVKGLE